MSVQRREIVGYLNAELRISEIEDSSRNGLQVEGAEEISKIGLAVDACMAVYEKAADAGCDMIFVHHGLIWDGIKYVTGRPYRHLRYLISNNLNLYAAHLPLDMHPDFGNNAELAKLLKLEDVSVFGHYKGREIGFSGGLSSSHPSGEISEMCQKKLGGTSVVLPFGKSSNVNVGIVSGGASDILNEAIEKELDCFITGEGNYCAYHLAKEAGINVIFLGHYHSEKLGVQAVGRELQKKFGIETVFIDEPTIVNHF